MYKGICFLYVQPKNLLISEEIFLSCVKKIQLYDINFNHRNPNNEIKHNLSFILHVPNNLQTPSRAKQ